MIHIKSWKYCIKNNVEHYFKNKDGCECLSEKEIRERERERE